MTDGRLGGRLIALGVTTYLALLGPQGLRSVAEASWRMAHYAADQVATIPGVEIITHDSLRR